MKPILKWVGGKTQILPQVLEEFPDEIRGDYYEPFVGGASVLLAAIPRVRGHVYASDVNPALIAVYEKIKNEPRNSFESWAISRMTRQKLRTMPFDRHSTRLRRLLCSST
jgi:DNA adenine methylase